MDILIATNDLIENNVVDCQNLNEFLRMAEDYKYQLLMDEINKEESENQN